MSTSELWTSREVHFTPFPRTSEEDWETLFDALPEHYWQRWWSRWFEPGIGASGRVLHVSGWPWWIPRPLARRSVAKQALAVGVGGDATYRTERVSMPKKKAQ